MGKMKTNKSVAKRFRRNGGGKIVAASANRRHLLTHKSSSRKRRLRTADNVIGGEDAKRIARMAPYL